MASLGLILKLCDTWCYTQPQILRNVNVSRVRVTTIEWKGSVVVCFDNLIWLYLPYRTGNTLDELRFASPSPLFSTANNPQQSSEWLMAIGSLLNRKLHRRSDYSVLVLSPSCSLHLRLYSKVIHYNSLGYWTCICSFLIRKPKLDRIKSFVSASNPIHRRLRLRLTEVKATEIYQQKCNLILSLRNYSEW